MASTFVATGTYSNLTRLQLEQLRKADFFAGSKALTVGDSALPPEGVVGPGDINAEPFLTGPNVLLDDVYALTPAPQPGPGLATVDQPAVFVSETTKWFGPKYIVDGTAGRATSGAIWSDTSGVNFTLAGVLPGDILLIKPGINGELNANAVGTVNIVTATTLTCINIHTAGGGGSFTADSPTQTTSYLVMRPSALQLFAVPASGATGFEQTFLAVVQGSTLHNNVAPTTDQINADRIKNLVPSQYALNSTVDRADAVFDAPGPRLSLDKLGYRLVLYPDNGLGTGPNLGTPIATLNPVIDPGIPSTDQRFTIDYKAGVIRFSCEPKIGGQIKVTGGVNGTTGRLNLYAVFWAVDTTLTLGSARALYGLRSTSTGAKTPGKVIYDTTNSAWRLGATTSTNAMLVQAPDPSEDTRLGVSFGAYDSTSVHLFYRFFSYRPLPSGSNRWRFTNTDQPTQYDTASTVEMPVGQALQYTVADFASPPSGGADFMPQFTLNVSSFGRGARDTSIALTAALAQAAVGDFGTVRLKRGRYQITDGVIFVPPGVIIEGDGANTVIQVRNITPPSNTTITPGFKFGPNTPWGVYDLTWNGTAVLPVVFDYSSSNVAQRLEGVCVIWNTVRRVWAIAWADVNLDAVWFNEIHRDGTTTFPGYGVNVKTTVAHLFSTLSPNSSNHSGGHYPRLCHQANADEYAVAWVDEFTLTAVVGPAVQISAFTVNPAIPDPTAGNPGGTPASLTTNFLSAFTPTGTAYTNHPSLAADNSSTSPFWPLFFGYWQYNLTAGQITSSSVISAVGQVSNTVGAVMPSPHYSANNFVFSSTDVDEDGAGNALFVWSLRMHPLITGTQGNINLSGQVTDPSISNWINTGIVVGSKFSYLGNIANIPSGAAYDTVYGVANTPYRFNLIPYGFDGTVANVVAGSITPKVNFSGTTYSPGSAYREVSSVYTSIAGALLNDTTVNFNNASNQVHIGDQVTLTRSGETHTVVNVNSNTQLQLDSVITGATPHNYVIWYGAAFNWAVTPPSRIEGQQYTAATGFVTPIQFGIAGNTVVTTSYTLEPSEPDFVRIRRGGDNWIVVFQSFETTSFFAHDSQTNWNDAQTTWNGNLFQDNTLIMREIVAPWRRHISTCAVILSDNGLPLNVPYNSIIFFPSSTPNSSFDTKASRDTEISARSLGAIQDPLTYRPNYVNTASPYFRYPWNLALQVSPLCWMQRWTSTSSPSLIPDVTWTGEDWVVVSPTKKAIHGYTGNYIVDSGGQVYLGDPGFYFGEGGTNAVDQNFLRQTVETGDLIFFPAISKYGTINGIHSEHTVTLSNTDVSLFNKGNGTQTGNTEWILVRAQASGTPRPGGLKTLGYRVGLDGRVIISSSYNTFADELSDNASLGTPGVTDRLPLMSRSNQDRTFYWANLSGDGHNLPGNVVDDLVEPEARYMGDVGFRGVAPGQPHGCNDQSPGENAFCAIAWGENFYGFMEHIIEGSTSLSSARNYVHFYRQSFGPYHSGMRNLKLQGYATPPLPVPFSTGSELKVLSQQLVFTRHGAPYQGNGYFATDGFRNLFLAADKRGTYAFNVAFGLPGAFPYTGGTQPCVQGFYTDAIGRFSIQMQGPETQDRPYPGLTQPQPNTLRCDVQTTGASPVPLSTSAPRVIWDGTRFVAFWVESGLAAYEIGTMLCMTTFPGGEDAGLQGPELVNPNDFRVMRRVSQIAIVDPRSIAGIGNVIFFVQGTNLAILDVAFSGRTYAVLWAAGLDPGAPAISGQAAQMLGVTLFDNIGAGGTFFDYDPLSYFGSTTGSVASGTPTFLSDTNPPLTSFTANIGDVAVINSPSDIAGSYIIVNISSAGHVVVYPPIPAITHSGNVHYNFHRPKAPGGGASFVLASQWAFDIHDAVTAPNIVWDGKQFVAVWRGNLSPQLNYSFSQEQAILCAEFPEYGFAHPQQVKRYGTIQTTSYGLEGDAGGLGFVVPGGPGATQIYMVRTDAETLSSTGTIAGAGGTTPTLTDGSVNFLTDKVSPGDLVIMTAGPNHSATIVGVSATVLNLSADYQIFSNGGGQAYTIWKKQQMQVQINDIVRITSFNYSGSDVSQDHGDYKVVSVDLYNNMIQLDTFGLPDTTGITFPAAYGTVLSGGGWGDQYQQGVTNLPFRTPGIGPGIGSNLALNFGQDIAPNPNVIGTAMVQGQLSPVATSVTWIYKLVYNEVFDEYALLYASSGTLAIGVFDRTTYQIKRETTLFTAGINFAKTADLAWNGTKYMAVWTQSGIPTGGNNPIPLQYAVITPQLQIEDLGIVNSVTGPAGIATIENLIGNLVGTVPGPTYQFGSFGGSQNTQPFWKTCQVKWNNRLNRWVVSGSLSWGAGTQKQNSGNYQTQELANEWHLGSTQVTSIVGNVLHVTLSILGDEFYFNPGFKIAWLDTGNATNSWGGMAMITAVNYTGGLTWALTTSTSSFPQFLTGTTGKLYMLPREDVFCWTVGYDTPTVQFEDADSCFLENVTFTGGTADIEERYKRMARPIWQSGGPPVGQIQQFSIAMRTSQYNHRLMTPTQKVEMPRFVNVRSYSKNRNGSGLVPGNPVFDRYANTRHGKG